MRIATMGKVLPAMGALLLTLLGGGAAPPALAADQPKVPQQVADYFADGLIPRLIDLYGAGDGVTAGIDFDATTTVGAISRVLEWTPDFLAGKSTDAPTVLTNDWVAPVSVRGSVIGLATVWINPALDAPELATFDPPELARALAAAPVASLLVHDPAREAWFAIDGDVLTPLVEGTSGATAPTTPDAYQRTIARTSTNNSSVDSGPPGVAIAALVLGIVIVGLAVFVLLPVRRRSGTGDDEDLDEADADADDTDARFAGDRAIP
ncbi:MAG TPA: hypothetical protein VFN04_06640 [Protaetiibacter sp.]|nr:hypothetical protein [Protaetiibacter sp.]